MIVITGAPGTGKTTRELQRMARCPGTYLLACPTLDLIAERVADIRRLAAEAGTDPLVVQLHSRADSEHRKVSRAIAEAPDDFADHTHVVVLITHEGLVSADLTSYDGWHAVLDEVPAAVVTGSMRIPASSRYFAAAYRLTDTVDGWSRVTPNGDAPGFVQIRDDELVSTTATLHRRAASPAGVLVKLGAWRDADDGRDVQWLSVWSLHELADAPFASVCVLGSGIMESLVWLVTQQIKPLLVEHEHLRVDRTASPTVRIRHFASQHRGSTNYWKEGVGCDNIWAIRDWLGSNPVGYWSANDEVARVFRRVGGTQVRPRIAGSNSLREHTSCAMIYSSKFVVHADRVLLDHLGITPEQITRAREYEDLRQFVGRGAIRDADYAGTYEIVVYEREQAEVLAEMFVADGIAASIEQIDAPGFVDAPRDSKPGRKVAATDTRTHEEKLAAKREQQRRSMAALRERQKVDADRAARKAVNAERDAKPRAKR